MKGDTLVMERQAVVIPYTCVLSTVTKPIAVTNSSDLLQVLYPLWFIKGICPKWSCKGQ